MSPSKKAGLEPFDPLESESDTGLLLAAQRREIHNILRSYTGFYDLFSELLQNALDAVDRSRNEAGAEYKPRIRIRIDMLAPSVTVEDNGCGMDEAQFRQFLRPNFSFKDGVNNRGSKGVGATFLGYGFNRLEVATKRTGQLFLAGSLNNGRAWVDDTSNTVPRPKLIPVDSWPEDFEKHDSGTSMRVTLVGPGIRPRDLSWQGATKADQWLAVLRIATPLGGIHLGSKTGPSTEIEVSVLSPAGEETTCTTSSPEYIFPHTVLGKCVSLPEFLSTQVDRATKHQDLSKIPHKFTGANGMWGVWSGDEILAGTAPLNPRLDEAEKALVRELGVRLYAFLCYSTELWDEYNDAHLKLRKGYRLLHGGLQLATRGMPQGVPIPIPMTNNIGFQNIAHVVVHLDSAEPDLGRKGFQPDIVALAGKLAVSAVTAFRRHFDTLLRKATGSPGLVGQFKLEQWVHEQEEHEKKYPLKIVGAGLFEPTTELPIASHPRVEQDVVALFNQMLSSGLIRGIQILSTSQYEQYDGLFRVRMSEPFARYVRGPNNPLGVDKEHFAGGEELASGITVLEYKHQLDSLVEEFQSGVKDVNKVGLAVVWRSGQRWREDFRAVSYLDPDNAHHRPYHGLTHEFQHATSGTPAFAAIVLEDLVNFLVDQEAEVARQRQLYGEDWDS